MLVNGSVSQRAEMEGRTSEVEVRRQPVVHSEFQTRQGYTVRLCFKESGGTGSHSLACLCMHMNVPSGHLNKVCWILYSWLCPKPRTLKEAGAGGSG